MWYIPEYIHESTRHDTFPSTYTSLLVVTWYIPEYIHESTRRRDTFPSIYTSLLVVECRIVPNHQQLIIGICFVSLYNDWI